MSEVVRWAALAVAMLMLVSLFVGGAQPEAAGLIPAPWDKLAHVAFFFVFAFLLSRFVFLPVAVVIVLSLLEGASNIRKDWGWSPSMAR
jgi:heme/copper-type cytochrome/quinol oxidase subunit 2